MHRAKKNFFVLRRKNTAGEFLHMFGLDESTVMIIGTCVSFFVSVCRILSFQIKSLKTLTLYQALLSFIYAIAFIFLGAYQGAAQNLVSTVLRLISLSDKKWAQSKIWIVIFSVFYLGFGIYFYAAEGWVSLLTGVVMIPYVIALWSHDAVKYKINYFCTTAPAWIIYNVVSMNIFGVFTESFNMVSIAISLLRKYFEDKKSKCALGAEKNSTETE